MVSSAPDSMAGRVVAITGATNGIGLEIARRLSAYGAQLVLLVRDPKKGEAVRRELVAAGDADAVTVVRCDLGSFASVRSAADDVLSRFGAIDVLCNNAGVILPERQLSADGCELTLQVNHFSHFLLTRLLEPALGAARRARVVTVSSDAHLAAWRGIPFGDLTLSRGWSSFGAYAISKLANIMFAYELARRLEGAGVTSNAMHPGVARTGFGTGDWGAFGGVWKLGRPLYPGPEVGAETAVYLVSSAEVESVSGRYFYRGKPKRSSPASYDLEAQRALWDVSERLVAGYLEP